jgi:hypothetical protein
LTLKIEMVYSSEISVFPYKTMWCQNPEDHILISCFHKNVVEFFSKEEKQNEIFHLPVVNSLAVNPARGLRIFLQNLMSLKYL